MRSIIAVAILLISVSFAQANDIYINQIGDNLDLDITQDGNNNQFGDSTTDVSLNGDDMTFAITQTGNGNDIAALINGNSYTGTWQFTGNTNTVALDCDNTNGTNCENITLNITTTGDSNAFTFAVGTNADADGSTIAFTVDGDNNVFSTTVDGESAALTVVVDNENTVNSATPTAGNVTAGAGGNALDIDITGDGDSAGHTVNLDITGGGSSYVINQSGVNDNMIDGTFNGDAQDVDITQSD